MILGKKNSMHCKEISPINKSAGIIKTVHATPSAGEINNNFKYLRGGDILQSQRQGFSNLFCICRQVSLLLQYLRNTG